MSDIDIHSNLMDMLKKPQNFEILDHVNVDDMDNLVRKSLIILAVKNKCEENIIRDQLIEHLSSAMYEIVTVYDIAELFKVIKKNISKVGYIYATYPIISHAWMIKKSALDFYMIIKSLNDFEIGIFPDNELSYFTNSLIYHKMMQDHYPEFAMPGSVTIFYPAWNNVFMDEYVKKVVFHIDKLKKSGHKGCILKRSFSDNKYGKRCLKLSGDMNDKELEKIVKSLDYTKKSDDDDFVNRGNYDKGSFKIVVVQPYNKEASGMVHSMLFVDGKFTGVYYANSDKTVEHYDNPFLNKLQDFGKRVLFKFIKNYAKKIPAIVRLDIGVAVSEKLQDEHSVELDGKKLRFYLKNMDIGVTCLFDCTKEGSDFNQYVDDNQKYIYKGMFTELYQYTENTKILDLVKKI